MSLAFWLAKFGSASTPIGALGKPYPRPSESGKARPSRFLLEDFLQSLLVSTLYWLKLSATPRLPTPVQLVVLSLKSLCLAVGSILTPPINSTLGLGHPGRSLLYDHASVVLVTPPKFLQLLLPIPVLSGSAIPIGYSLHRSIENGR